MTLKTIYVKKTINFLITIIVFFSFYSLFFLLVLFEDVQHVCKCRFTYMEIFLEIRCICCLIFANKLLTTLDGKFVLVLLRLSVFYSLFVKINCVNVIRTLLIIESP